MISKVIGVSAFRNNIAKLLNEIINSSEPIAVGTDEKTVVVLPLDKYNELQKFYDDYKDSEYLLSDAYSLNILKENIAQIGSDSNKIFSFDELDSFVKESLEESE